MNLGKLEDDMKNAHTKIPACAVLGFALACNVAHAEQYLVGSEVPLTGPLSRVGAGMKEGIAVATDVFNRRGGKHKIRISSIDDESSPAKAVAAVGDRQV